MGTYSPGAVVQTTDVWTRAEPRPPLVRVAPIPAGELPPDSPEWWRDRLIAQMESRRADVERYERYYDGDHPLAFATSRFREAFGNTLKALRDDWVSIVVDAPVERLAVEGFRTGNDEPADADAWRIWQANGLDAESVIAHTEAVKLAACYLVVGDDGGGKARIIVEHPLRAAVALDPTNPRVAIAGAQRWKDIHGLEHVRVWTTDTDTEWTRTGDAQWTVDHEAANALGQVPVVLMANNPGLSHRTGRSDLKVMLPMQDVINKLSADLVVASEYAAFRQRWVTGVEIPTDPATGEPMNDQWVAAINRIWTVESESARFGEFQASDLTNYVKAIEMFVRHIAAQTRTPPHYLMGEIVNASADALRAAEAGLVSRVRRKQLAFGESWEQVMRLAFRVEGLDADKLDASEVIWRDPETRTEGETVDAATKLVAIGVPKRAVWARLPGVTPTKLEQWTAEAAAETVDTTRPEAEIRLYDIELGVVTKNERRDRLGLPPIAGGNTPIDTAALAQQTRDGSTNQ